MLDSLRTEAPRYGISLTDAQLLQFERYVTLLAEWNQRVNLVSDATADVVLRRHIIESLALGASLREREVLRPDARIIEIGAGAGFPSLPIKISWPSIRLALLEATAKKTAFLSAVVEALDLSDTVVVTGRAEELGHDPSLRDGFDLVLARAVAPLPALLELTLPFARIGGRVVAPKGSRVEEEVAASKRALSVLGAKLFVVPLDVPGPKQKIVVAVKQAATPPEYPRRAGVPSKSPL
ncbi:MAG: 16S rRNA (guanine(527)-N(7))-methyltransferase RsmG [Dehalococcoidia bacterium]